jgi:hypothetical protein
LRAGGGQAGEEAGDELETHIVGSSDLRQTSEVGERRRTKAVITRRAVAAV